MVRLLILIIAFGFTGNALAADCGQFKVVKGQVSYKKKSKKQFKDARINKKICQGDLVKTGNDSRAKIVMADKNEINISPDTELLIEVYQKDKKAVLNVLNGKVRSNVKGKYQDNDNSHYRVKTKSAVAGVRGTEFLASYSRRTNESRVVTFEGEVMVGKVGVGGRISARVSVKPGQFTSNKPGQNPHPAKDVPPAEFAQMDQDTNVGDSGGDKGPASAPRQNNNKNDDAGDADQPDDAGGSSDNRNENGEDSSNNSGDQASNDKENNRRRMRGPRGPASVGPDGIDSSDDLGGNDGPDDLAGGDRGPDNFDGGSADDGNGPVAKLPPPEPPKIDDPNGGLPPAPTAGPELGNILNNNTIVDNAQNNPATTLPVQTVNGTTKVTIEIIPPGTANPAN